MVRMLALAFVVVGGLPDGGASPGFPQTRSLAAALLGTWMHGDPANTLSLTLRADATFTLTQPGAPALVGAIVVTGPESGPWRLRLQTPGAADPLPEYTLRALDADHLGLSGGALAFEVTLTRDAHFARSK
jgi:hypothetical protein